MKRKEADFCGYDRGNKGMETLLRQQGIQII